MPRPTLLTAAALAALTLLGCDKTDKGQKEAQSASPAVAAAHSSDTPATLQTTPPTLDPANPPASSGPGTATIVPPATQPAADIQPQVEQAMQYVKDRKYDLAEKALDQLDQQKTSWSAATRETWTPRIDRVRQALTAAKGGSSALDALKGAAIPTNK